MVIHGNDSLHQHGTWATVLSIYLKSYARLLLFLQQNVSQRKFGLGARKGFFCNLGEYYLKKSFLFTMVFPAEVLKDTIYKPPCRKPWSQITDCSLLAITFLKTVFPSGLYTLIQPVLLKPEKQVVLLVTTVINSDTGKGYRFISIVY